MAVAVAGTVTSLAGTANATSVTFAWNNSASANYLAVAVTSWDSTPADAVVSGVTYGGVAMAPLGARQDPGNEAVSIWGLVNPAAGSNNVVVTMGGACAEFIGGAIGFTGVDTAAPAGTFAGADYNNVSGTTATCTVTSETDALVLAALYVNTNPTVSGGTATERWEVFAYGGTYSNGQTVVGATTVTPTWTFTSTSWVCGGVSIRPAAAFTAAVASAAGIGTATGVSPEPPPANLQFYRRRR